MAAACGSNRGIRGRETGRKESKNEEREMGRWTKLNLPRRDSSKGQRIIVTSISAHRLGRLGGKSWVNKRGGLGELIGINLFNGK